MIAGLPEVRTGWLKSNDLDGDDELLLRRVVDAGGRSRAYINGSPATVQQLREVGEWLVDIHGQHAHQSLLRADAQRALLDAHAGLTAWRDVGVAWKALARCRAIAAHCASEGAEACCASASNCSGRLANSMRWPLARTSGRRSMSSIVASAMPPA
jgi:DNA repair protein RecN (Recombination protein N)